MIVLPAALSDDDDSQILFAKRRCMSLCFPSDETTSSSWWQTIQSPENRERWWFLRWKAAREWSEIVAGPKWKTFIRGFRNNNNNGGARKQCSFHYDPLSYALNFDDGNSAVDDGYAGFSARFAAFTPPEKELMRQGSRDEHVPTVSKIENRKELRRVVHHS